jgi:hypothetical protein
MKSALAFDLIVNPCRSRRWRLGGSAAGHPRERAILKHGRRASLRTRDFSGNGDRDFSGDGGLDGIVKSIFDGVLDGILDNQERWFAV